MRTRPLDRAFAVSWQWRAMRRWLRALVLGSSILAMGSTSAAVVEEAPPPTIRWNEQADTVFHHLTSIEMRFAVAITQDGAGFIWLGSQEGLVRWDGYRSRLYHADPQDATALPDNFVAALHTDRLGRLWVGTAVGGLARYDPERDAFVVFGAGANGLRSSSVSAIADAGSTGLWIGTSDGLDHIDLASNAVIHVAVAVDQHVAVKAVLQDADGGLWVGTDRGLEYQRPGSDEFRAVSLKGAGSVTPEIETLFRDSHGNLWIGTRPYGAFVIESGQPTARPVHETAVVSRLEGEVAISIVEAKPGEIWIGTSGGGVVVVDTAAGWRTRRLQHQAAVATSLQDDDMHAMYRDRAGLIWASSTMALNLYDPRPTGIATLFGVEHSARPVTAVQVPFVMVTSEDRVWLSAGDGGGVDILDPVLGRIGELRTDPAHPRSKLPAGRVLTMVEAADGAVYIGTRQGLYRSDAQGRLVTRVEISQRAADAPVFSLCFDDGVLWVGGTDGLWALRLKPRASPLLLRHETAERLGSRRVTAILRGAGDTLWVGTAAGLNRLDIASSTLESFPTEPSNPTGFLGGYVASLLMDRQGRLWIASVGNGIQVLEGRDSLGRARFRRLGIHEGLPHYGIDKLILDLGGNIWASTDNGLAEIDPATFAVRTLGEAQGVPITQYWTNSGARTSRGELLFGGEGGLTVVQPERTTTANPTLAPIVVTEAYAGGKPFMATRLNGAGEPPRLDVAADNHSLMVEFAALDYAAPENNRYRYRLQGFDNQWVESQATHRLAAYTNLPPGNYTLQLSGSGPVTPQIPAIREIPIRVLPAWYQTTWFRLAAAALAFLGLVAISQLRTALLRRRQRELQEQVSKRTMELEQRSAELQQRSAELELSSAELRRAQLQLESIAYLDPLTGISNRRLFDMEMQQLTSAALRGAAMFTLLLLDLDRFKQVNDTLGHDAGDALLIEVTRRLRLVLRASDRLFRLGGDEFAVLLVETGDAASSEAACVRLVENLAEPFAYGDQLLQPGASIGAARWSAQAPSPDDMYRRADQALYEAKKAGRNTWRWYEPRLRDSATLVPS